MLLTFDGYPDVRLVVLFTTKSVVFGEVSASQNFQTKALLRSMYAEDFVARIFKGSPPEAKQCLPSSSDTWALPDPERSAAPARNLSACVSLLAQCQIRHFQSNCNVCLREMEDQEYFRLPSKVEDRSEEKHADIGRHCSTIAGHIPTLPDMPDFIGQLLDMLPGTLLDSCRHFAKQFQRNWRTLTAASSQCSSPTDPLSSKGLVDSTQAWID